MEAPPIEPEYDAPPGESFLIGRWAFLRVFGIAFLFAHLSLAHQIVGLVGAEGIQPAVESLRALREQYGPWAVLRAPSIYWLSAHDITLWVTSWIGVGFAALLFLNVRPRLALVASWFLYLSAASLHFPGIGGFFFDFPPDHVVLEGGAFAIFLTPRGIRPGLGRETPIPGWTRILLAGLLFKLMFGSGVAKLVNGGASWFDGSALYFDSVTRPSPTPLAVYTQDAPLWLLSAATVFVLVAEVVAPLFYFARGNLRRTAAWITLLLLGSIMLTGNYRWFPLATCGLSLLLLDDRAWGRQLARLASRRTSDGRPPRTTLLPRLLVGLRRSVIYAATTFVLVLGACQTLDSCYPAGHAPNLLGGVRKWMRRFRISHGFHLFGKIGEERHVIVFEGSDDGRDWREFDCRLNPGDPERPHRFVAPYHYFLDFVVWLAGPAKWQEHAPWLSSFLRGLLRGTPEIYALFANAPFSSEAPPRFVRGRVYAYRFADAATRERGRYWERELRGAWSPTVTLRGGELEIVR